MGPSLFPMSKLWVENSGCAGYTRSCPNLRCFRTSLVTLSCTLIVSASMVTCTQPYLSFILFFRGICWAIPVLRARMYSSIAGHVLPKVCLAQVVNHSFRSGVILTVMGTRFMPRVTFFVSVILSLSCL